MSLRFYRQRRTTFTSCGHDPVRDALRSIDSALALLEPLTEADRELYREEFEQVKVTCELLGKSPFLGEVRGRLNDLETHLLAVRRHLFAVTRLLNSRHFKSRWPELRELLKIVRRKRAELPNGRRGRIDEITDRPALAHIAETAHHVLQHRYPGEKLTSGAGGRLHELAAILYEYINARRPPAAGLSECIKDVLSDIIGPLNRLRPLTERLTVLHRQRRATDNESILIGINAEIGTIKSEMARIPIPGWRNRPRQRRHRQAQA